MQNIHKSNKFNKRRKKKTIKKFFASVLEKTTFLC